MPRNKTLFYQMTQTWLTYLTCLCELGSSKSASMASQVGFYDVEVDKGDWEPIPAACKLAEDVFGISDFVQIQGG